MFRCSDEVEDEAERLWENLNILLVSLRQFHVFPAAALLFCCASCASCAFLDHYLLLLPSPPLPRTSWLLPDWSGLVTLLVCMLPGRHHYHYLDCTVLQHDYARNATAGIFHVISFHLITDQVQVIRLLAYLLYCAWSGVAVAALTKGRELVLLTGLICRMGLCAYLT